MGVFFVKRAAFILLVTMMTIGFMPVTTHAYNQTQLDKIKTGSRLCNGFDLSNANLSNLNLQEAHLEGANLTGANLFRTNLAHAHLKGANLYKANLKDANLNGTDMTSVRLTGAIMPDGTKHF